MTQIIIQFIDEKGTLSVRADAWSDKSTTPREIDAAKEVTKLLGPVFKKLCPDSIELNRPIKAFDGN